MSLPPSFLDFVPGRPAFPDEVLCNILGNLSFRELVTASRVCRAMHRAARERSLWDAFDLRRIFPGVVSVLGLPFWQKHGNLEHSKLEVGKSFDMRIAIPALIKIFALLERNSAKMPLTVLTIPKGLLIDHLMFIAMMNGIKFHFGEDSLSMLRESLVDKTYHVVITQGVLEKSKALSQYQQRQLLTQIGASMPRGLDACVLAVGTFITSSQPPLHVFGQGTMTRCMESHGELPWHVTVGNFSPPQDPNPHAKIDLHVYEQFPDPNIGVAAVWYLPDSE